MDSLYIFHDNLIKQIDDTFFRFLIHTINWEQRMLAIKGPRGTGKTTLMLQYIRYYLKQPREKVLYVTADHYWFYTHNLVETADEFYKNGGRFLFIDEVHKYPNWSRELKNIYDGYPDLRVVFSSSSALDIYRGEADLSRRVISYDLPGLSFREFLNLEANLEISAIPWNDLISRPNELARDIVNDIQPLPFFKQYLRHGYFPYFKESIPEELPVRLNQTINTVVETDLAFIQGYSQGTAFKVKKLLGVLAESVPFKPNISALARKLDVSRETVYAWFVHLEKARMLNLLLSKGKGVSTLQKPEKVYLENTNLAFAMKTYPDLGAIRETFLLSQLINAKLSVTLPSSGDFYVSDMHIEVGGKNKKASQVKTEAAFLVAADDIEIGFGTKVPLWLFGFLY
ncbi:AAA family ATPase [Cyclobacterium sp.]|uniref:ATP-binding protein n=1 Tax=Cyclobacterium sp. TaxID=1966343 RepID=UPI0019CA6C87|nr:AAA family ATPase [Cyclobacterium sp.]MBD3630547.1 AAA family ATPase [Cyclobacterium sp.]